MTAAAEQPTAAAAPTSCVICRAPLPAPKKPGVKPRIVCSPQCMQRRREALANERHSAAKVAGAHMMRVCVDCNRDKHLARGHWVFVAGVPHGNVCSRCNWLRKKARARAKAAQTAATPITGTASAAGTARGNGKSTRQFVKAARQIASIAAAAAHAVTAADAQRRAMLSEDAKAVLLGAKMIDAVSQKVADEIGRAVEDEDHPYHLHAVQLLIDRILPMAAYNQAAKRAIRSVEEEDDTVAVFVGPVVLPVRGSESQ